MLAAHYKILNINGGSWAKHRANHAQRATKQARLSVTVKAPEIVYQFSPSSTAFHYQATFSEIRTKESTIRKYKSSICAIGSLELGSITHSHNGLGDLVT